MRSIWPAQRRRASGKRPASRRESKDFRTAEGPGSVAVAAGDFREFTRDAGATAGPGRDDAPDRAGEKAGEKAGARPRAR